jgi:hypothetical protein
MQRRFVEIPHARTRIVHGMNAGTVVASTFGHLNTDLARLPEKHSRQL